MPISRRDFLKLSALGEAPIWRKAISLPLSGGSASAAPSSRGCVNAGSEDAKWIFRWSNPIVPYEPGDVTVEWPGGTKVNVVES